MNEHQPQALSNDLPRDPLRFLRGASAAEAKSLNDEQDPAAQQEEEMNEHQPQALSTDLPSESPLGFLRRTSAADATSLSDEEERGLAAELKRTARASQAMRTAAYRDAITVVARQMQRRAQNLTCWTEKDAEAAREIAEILISLDSQGATAPDPAFAR